LWSVLVLVKWPLCLLSSKCVQKIYSRPLLEPSPMYRFTCSTVGCT
jgi:hypothetical protein